MFYLWLTIAILLILVEILTLSFTTFWFALAAIVAMVASNYINDFFIQFVIFASFGITTRLIAKPFFTNLIKKIKIGAKGIVIKTVYSEKMGEVQIGNKILMALSDKKISEGTKVIVSEISEEYVKIREI